VINDVTTTTVASGAILFVIIDWMTIHFGRNPRNGGRPPKDNSDLNLLALCYKPEGRGFDSGRCHWNFSLT
jgi:hypothetical protein